MVQVKAGGGCNHIAKWSRIRWGMLRVSSYQHAQLQWWIPAVSMVVMITVRRCLNLFVFSSTKVRLALWVVHVPLLLDGRHVTRNVNRYIYIYIYMVSLCTLVHGISMFPLLGATPCSGDCHGSDLREVVQPDYLGLECCEFKGAAVDAHMVHMIWQSIAKCVRVCCCIHTIPTQKSSWNIENTAKMAKSGTCTKNVKKWICKIMK